MRLPSMVRCSSAAGTFVSLMLYVGIGAASAAEEPPSSRDINTVQVASEPLHVVRLPDGLWPVGTPAQVIFGATLDTGLPIGDALTLGSWVESLPFAGTTPFSGASPPAALELEDEQAGETVSGDGAWSLVPPPTRSAHSAVYDPVRHRMVLFGGTDGIVRNDVWALSLKNHARWRPLLSRGEPPNPRLLAAVVYDPIRDRMIVFGGSKQAGAGADLYGDVWELALRGHPTWRQILPAGVGPSPRRGASAIYDPARDRMVIFGGLTGDDKWSGETWALSLDDAGTWTRLEAPGTPPPPRWRHTAVYDAVRQQMVVFGGNGVSGFVSNDTYALSLGTAPEWTPIAPAGGLPPRMFGHSAICDPVRGQMVVFGGHDGYLNSDNTWVLSLSGVPSWSHLDVAPTPPRRSSHVTVYDPARERLVIHGGGNASLENDTWALNLATSDWTRLNPVFGAPPHRAGHSAIYDPVRDRMIIYGTNYGVSDSEFDSYGGAWALSLAPRPEWRPIAWAGRPPLIGNHPAFYDPVEDRMLVLRGLRQDMSEVWQLMLRDESWSALTPAGPIPEAPGYVTSVFDLHNRRIVVFGLGATQRQTWALELDGGPRWVPLFAAKPPPERFAAMATYDPIRQRMIVFGGVIEGAPSDDLWALSLSGPPVWTRLIASGVAPGPFSSGSAIYDPLGDRMVLYGGLSRLGYVDAVWSLSLGGVEHWRRLHPLGSRPPWRASHTAMHDPRRGRMVVVGGGGNGILADTWSLDLRGESDPEPDAEDEGDEEQTANPPMLAATLSHASGAGAIEVSRGLSVRNEPNPFARSTQIELLLPRSCAVRVSVRDAQGREVRELARGDLHAGRRVFEWDGLDATGRALPTGLYFLSVEAGDDRLVRKTLLLR